MSQTGRPRLEFDLQALEDFCAQTIECPDTEIAAEFGCHEDTIKNRRRDEPKFEAAIQRGRRRARSELRKSQFAAAKNGNPAMMIWLGKQYLDQHEVSRHELTGAEGKPIEVDHGDAFRHADPLAAVYAGLEEVGALPDASAARPPRSNGDATKH